MDLVGSWSDYCPKFPEPINKEGDSSAKAITERTGGIFHDVLSFFSPRGAIPLKDASACRLSYLATLASVMMAGRRQPMLCRIAHILLRLFVRRNASEQFRSAIVSALRDDSAGVEHCFSLFQVF
jgi:hypothetical protein